MKKNTTERAITDKIKDTRFMVLTSYDDTESLLEKLSDKFKDGKMYGTMHAYFIYDGDLPEVLARLQSAWGDEAKFEAALNERCVFGFDLLDMTLKQRVHQETTDVKLNINMFSNVRTKLCNAHNMSIPDAVTFIKERRYHVTGC